VKYLTWNIDPTLIAIGGMEIRWYGLMFATAFLLGYEIMKWIYIREKKDIQYMDQLLIYIIGGTIIGARLGHCLFYDPDYYLANPLKILAVWEGGLASHGGGVGALTGLYLYKLKTRESYLWLLDRIAIPAALAGSLIRFGNLFNSEIVGIPTAVPWAIIFERVDAVPRHPVQVYEALSYLMIFFILMVIYRKGGGKPKAGLIFGMFLVLVFTARIFMEFVKTIQEAYSLDSWMNTGQMLSVPFLVAGVVFLICSFKGGSYNKS